jgi:cupredoxin-like protein
LAVPRAPFHEPPKTINPPLGRTHLLFRKKNPAISRTVAVGIVVVLVLAVGAGEYLLSKPNTNAPVEVDMQIIEDDPVLQIQHFYPDNVTLKLNQNVTLAIRNGDDEPRTFVLKEFNVNFTMSAGTTQRATFQATKTGTFLFYSPPSVPSPVSQGRPGMYIQGNFIVTQ